MSVSSVSFGQVIAVSGKKKHTKLLRFEMSKNQNISVLDATHYYLSSVTDGLLNKAAKRYDHVDIYVTGEDNISLTEKKEGWRTLTDVLSNIDKYYDLRKININTVKQMINNSK